MNYLYSHAALGGTFDHLHIGHHHLLQTALKQAEKITIGLTTKDLYQDKSLSSLIEEYDLREAALKEYLHTQNALKRVTIIPLEDSLGPTVDDNDIDMLVVTSQTKEGAQNINKIRSQKGLSPLPVKTAQLVKDQAGRYISSTRIRQGRINQEGVVFSLLFQKNIRLKAQQKQALQIPQGQLFQSWKALTKKVDIQTSTKTCLVGDRVTSDALQNDVPFHYAIYDRQIMRQPLETPHQFPADFSEHSIPNPPGHITSQAASLIKEMLTLERATLKVDGEEDLLAVPMALMLPLGSSLIYGQPERGVIHVPITLPYKNKLYAIFNKANRH